MKDKKTLGSKVKLDNEINESAWKSIIEKLPLNTSERHCECAIIAEANPESTPAMENINLMSGLDIFDDAYLITYKDILDVVAQNCTQELTGKKSKMLPVNLGKKPQASQKSLKSSSRVGSKMFKEHEEFSVQELMANACLEASSFPKDAILPADLLAKIIKLHLINLRESDIMRRKQVIVADKDLLAKYQVILDEPETHEGKHKGKGKGKGKKGKKGSSKSSIKSRSTSSLSGSKKKGKKDKKGKSSKSSLKSSSSGTKKKGKGGKKGKKGSTEETDFCKSVNSIQTPPPPNFNFKVEFKPLYFILSGFYDNELLEELHKCGISLGCIVQVLDPNKEKRLSTAVIKEKVPSNELPTNGSVLSQDASRSTWDDTVPSKSNSNTLCSDNVEQEIKDTKIENYWETLFHMLNDFPPKTFLNNTYFVRYLVKKYYFPSRNSIKTQEYLICQEICNLVREMKDLRRQYRNYLNNIKIINVEDPRTPIPTRHMKTYNKIMNKIPPECINVPIILFGVLEELMHRLDCPKPRNDKRNDIEIVSDFDLFDEEENAAETAESEKPSHGGIRSEIMKVLRSYQHKHSMYYQENTIKYLSPQNLKVNITVSPLVPNVVQYGNYLELQYGHYRKLCKILLNINLNALKTLVPVKKWEIFGNIQELQSLINNHHLFMWSNRLDVPVQELINGIHGIMCKILALLPEQTQVNAEMKTSKFEKFPRKTRRELLEESLPTIQNMNLDLKGTKSMVSQGSSLTTVLSFENIHEAEFEPPSTTENYKWVEHLPPTVMLQVLKHAYEYYDGLNYLHFPFTDVLLLNFHHNFNKDGFSVQVVDHCLRTTVSLREFCQFILADEKEWIDEQEAAYQDRIAKGLEKAKTTENLLRFPNLPEDNEYVLNDSLKYRELHPEPTEMDASHSESKTKHKKKGKEKKGKKKSKTKLKKSSSKSSKTHVNECNADLPTSKCKTSNVKFPEDLFQDTVKEQLLAQQGEPTTDIEVTNPAFIGYNVSNFNRMQLIGAETNFNSFDGVTVAVDSTRWFGTPNQFTVALQCNGNTIIMHKPPLYCDDKDFFKFHINFENGLIIVLGRPNNEYEPCTEIMKQVEQSLADEKITNQKLRRKYQKIFFIEETHNTILKCFKIPRLTTTSQPLLLSQDFLLPFNEKMNEIKNTNVKTSKMVHNKNTYSAIRNKFKVIVPKQMECNQEENNIQSAENIFKSESSLSIVAEKHRKEYSPSTDAVLAQKKDMVEKLKSAISAKAPLYKICSSKLHQFQYVTRVKSHVEIPLGKVIKRFAYRPRFVKTKKMTEVKTCLPLQPLDTKHRTKLEYEFRATLPTGLCVQTVPALKPIPFQVKQFYIDKGPVCKSIEGEEYRVVLRGGHVLIKKCNGDVTFLSVNGKILNLTMGFFCMRTRTKVRYKPVFSVTKFADIERTKSSENLKRRCKHGPVSLHNCTKDLNRFQKILNKTIQRRQKHLIHGLDERYYKSRRVQMRKNKKRFRIPEYYVKSNGFSYPYYVYITTDGTEVRVSNDTVSSFKNKYYFTYEMNFSTEEILYKREDGTSMLLKRDASLSTKFPDGTKITSQPVVETEEVFAMKDSSSKVENEPNKMTSPNVSYNTFDSDSLLDRSAINGPRISKGGSFLDDISNAQPMDEGFVYIKMIYIYEHENFATVTYDSLTEVTEIQLPHAVDVTLHPNGTAEMFLDKHCQLKANKTTVEFDSSLCSFCKEACHCEFNVKPLYNKQPAEEKEKFFILKDSYDKYFSVNYEGLCFRNDNSKFSVANRSGCLVHHRELTQRTFVLQRDLSGFELIKEEEKENHLQSRKFDQDATVAFQTDEKDEVKQIETRKFLYKTHAQTLLRTYPIPELNFTKEYSHQPNSLRRDRALLQPLIENQPVACCLRILCALPSNAAIEPVSTALSVALKNGYFYRNSEEFDLLVDRVFHPVLKRSKEEEKVKIAKDLHKLFMEKWLAWKRKCDMMESIAHSTPPNYFKYISEEQSVTDFEAVPNMPSDTPSKQIVDNVGKGDNVKKTEKGRISIQNKYTRGSSKYNICPGNCYPGDKVTNDVDQKTEEKSDKMRSKSGSSCLEDNTENEYSEGFQNEDYQTETIQIPIYGDKIPEKMIIHSKKQTVVEQKGSKTITKVSEELEFDVPKDVVLIYEQGTPIRTMTVQPQEIKILAEKGALSDPMSRFVEIYNDIAINSPTDDSVRLSVSRQMRNSVAGSSTQSMLARPIATNKLLIMTNVPEDTKVLIAKECSKAPVHQNLSGGIQFEEYAKVRDKIAAMEDLSFTNIVKTSNEGYQDEPNLAVIQSETGKADSSCYMHANSEPDVEESRKTTSIAINLDVERLPTKIPSNQPSLRNSATSQKRRVSYQSNKPHETYIYDNTHYECLCGEHETGNEPVGMKDSKDVTSDEYDSETKQRITRQCNLSTDGDVIKCSEGGPQHGDKLEMKMKKSTQSSESITHSEVRNNSVSSLKGSSVEGRKSQSEGNKENGDKAKENAQSIIGDILESKDFQSSLQELYVDTIKEDGNQFKDNMHSVKGKIPSMESQGSKKRRSSSKASRGNKKEENVNKSKESVSSVSGKIMSAELQGSMKRRSSSKASRGNKKEEIVNKSKESVSGKIMSAESQGSKKSRSSSVKGAFGNKKTEKKVNESETNVNANALESKRPSKFGSSSLKQQYEKESAEQSQKETDEPSHRKKYIAVIVDITRKIIRDLLNENDANAFGNEVYKVIEEKVDVLKFTKNQILKLKKGIGHSKFRKLILEEVALYNTLLLTKLHAMSDPVYQLHLQCEDILKTIDKKYSSKNEKIQSNSKEIVRRELKLISRRILDSYESMILAHQDCYLSSEEKTKFIADICNQLDSAKLHRTDVQVLILRIKNGVEMLLHDITPFVITSTQAATLIDLIEKNLSNYISKCTGANNPLIPKRYFRQRHQRDVLPKKRIEIGENVEKCCKCQEDLLEECGRSKTIAIKFLITPPDDTPCSFLDEKYKITADGSLLEDCSSEIFKKVKNKRKLKVPTTTQIEMAIVGQPALLQMFKDHSIKKDIPMYFTAELEKKSTENIVENRYGVSVDGKVEHFEYDSSVSSNYDMIPYKKVTAEKTASMIPLTSITQFDHIKTSSDKSLKSIKIEPKTRWSDFYVDVPHTIHLSKKSLDACKKCVYQLQQSKSSILTIYSKCYHDYVTTEHDDVSMIPVLSTFSITRNTSSESSDITLAELISDHKISGEIIDVSCEKELSPIAEEAYKTAKPKKLEKKVSLNLRGKNKIDESMMAMTSKMIIGDDTSESSNTKGMTTPTDISLCLNCKVLSTETPSASSSKISLVDSEIITCKEFLENVNKYKPNSKDLPETSPSMVPLYSRKSYLFRTSKKECSKSEIKESVPRSTSLGTQTQGDKLDAAVQKDF